MEELTMLPSVLAAAANGASEDTINLTDSEWFGDDEWRSPLPFDASEGGLWSGRFVPPPPRPAFLEDTVAPDGLTTCDLCSWAWHERNAFGLDGSMEAAGGLGWVLTLVIVSVISAAVGAVVMVTVLRCRRMKTSSATGIMSLCSSNVADGQGVDRDTGAKEPPSSQEGPGVWSWLGARRPPLTVPSSPAENHYTHMDDPYTQVGVSEALYAELDRESIASGNPYQNSAYNCETETDVPVSSAPSSAYYSDLSVSGATAPERDRAYEVVGLSVLSGGQWDEMNARRTQHRLAAITETTTTVPSDYV